MRSAALVGLPAASAERPPAPPLWRTFPSRTLTFCLVELQKLRHDRTELFTRAVQPILWLVIFGETFNRIHAIQTGNTSYLEFLTPGIIPKSASSRKQMRQSPKRRRKARERPQRPQRLCTRTWNFGFRLLFSIMAFRAIAVSLP